MFHGKCFIQSNVHANIIHFTQKETILKVNIDCTLCFFCQSLGLTAETKALREQNAALEKRMAELKQQIQEQRMVTKICLYSKCCRLDILRFSGQLTIKNIRTLELLHLKQPSSRDQICMEPHYMQTPGQNCLSPCVNEGKTQRSQK